MSESTIQFVINNWYLFAGLVVVVALLLAGPITQLMHGIKSLNPAQAIQLLNRESGVVVDVCEPREFKQAHVPDAVNIPLGQLGQQLAQLEKYKSKPVIIMCRTGNRSVRGAAILRKRGFTSVYALGGGMAAWQRENLPVKRDAPAPGK